MPRTVYLVSCVGKKQADATQAQDLYISSWFLKAKKYVLHRLAPGDSWYILSAKCGLVAPTEIITPYEVTLNTMPIEERKTWGFLILRQLSKIPRYDRVVFLAGDRYREFVEPAIRCPVEVPMRGLGIGKQLEFLSRTKSLL